MNIISKIYKEYFVAIILMILVMFGISFWFSYIFVFFKTPFGLGVISEDSSSDWLQWSGTIIGGIVGGVTGGLFAIAGIKITLDNQREEMKFENKRKALPMIDIKGSGEYDYTYKSIQFDFCLTEESNLRSPKDIPHNASVSIVIENVGIREMYDLYIGGFKSEIFKSKWDNYYISPISYQGKQIHLNLTIYEKGVYDNDDYDSLFSLRTSPISLTFYFRDCYDNWYYQEFDFILMHQLEKGVPAEETALSVNYQSYDIKSKPTEILEGHLPWKKGETLIHT